MWIQITVIMHKTAFHFLNLNDINKMLLLTLISQRKKFSGDAKMSLFGGILKTQITDHLKWTLHVWEGAGKHLRAKYDGLKSHPRPTPRQMVFINDHWSVNKNSEVVLKIFEVQFEIWLGKSNLMKRVENTRRARSNKKVEFKKWKTTVKTFSNDATSEGRV